MASNVNGPIGTARGRAGGLDEAVRMPKLSHVVADRLRSQIISGAIPVGSTLPPENDLLAKFDISRPTLREALRILEAESLINVGRGVRRGAVVLGANVDKVADYASALLASEGVTMFDLHEARTFFEPAVIRALGRLSPAEGDEAVKKVSSVLEEIDAQLEEKNYVAVVHGTQEFHQALARLSGNRTIAIFVEILHVISDDVYASTLLQEGATSAAATHTNMQKTVEGYHVLVDLLGKRKYDEASAFWLRYMERSGEFLRKTKLGNKPVVHQGAHGALRGD